MRVGVCVKGGGGMRTTTKKRAWVHAANGEVWSVRQPMVTRVCRTSAQQRPHGGIHCLTAGTSKGVAALGNGM
jgi:hypothetical protein